MECTKEKDIQEIRGRVEAIEGDMLRIRTRVEILQLGHHTLEKNMELIQKDMQYTKLSLDKIDKNVEKLMDQRVNDEFVTPLSDMRIGNRTRRSQIEGVIIGIIVTALLFFMFPFLTM